MPHIAVVSDSCAQAHHHDLPTWSGKKQTPALTKLPLCSLGVVLAIILSLFLFPSASAYAQVEKQKLAAIMVVINSLLLEEDTSVELDFNDYDGQARTISDNFQAVLVDTRNQDVEFCFYLRASQALPNSNLQLEINGVLQTGVNQPRSGENCYTIPVAQQRAENVVSISVDGGLIAYVSAMGLEAANQNRLGLPVLTRSGWDERAVRKVLKIFAFGGHATDSQIAQWANMRPRLAIAEMLNFSQHNLKLSPLSPNERYTETAQQHGTLTGFYNYIESSNSNIPIPVDEREYLGVNGYRFASTFGRMIAMRGLNPFRQRIGFWETNYHLAVNRNAGVERAQILAYYDTIMSIHEQRLPYHRVMGEAAKSAAVAMQYGHRRNWCRNSYIDNSGQCRSRLVDGELKCDFIGNADFAREISQLFFGIFGVDDPETHENVTIENSARMLTGMRVRYIEDFGFSTQVEFESCGHHEDKFGPLRILGQDITGVDAAAKIDNLMPISIQHPESLFNLPVYIVSTLADDSLTEPKRQQLRAAWAQLGPNKDFLTFIHAYATSEMFHSSEHVKYMSSFERAYYTANKFNIDNIEAFLSNDYFDGRAGRDMDDVMRGDNASEVFEPLHNVFGGQTSLEASNSTLAFEKNYNRSATDANWQFERENPSACDGCDQGQPWVKDWTKVIPSRNGGYSADYVATWLWKHVVGNMDNYTELERGQLLAILGAIRQPRNDGTEPNWYINNRYPFFDLNYLLCIREDRVERGQSGNQLADLMRYQSWDQYCRPYNGGYTQTEIDAFNLSFNGDQLQNSNTDPYPYLRGLIEELASQDVGLTNTDPILRRRANERVQAAMAFIFATPFVFAEGQ